jgi:hypothetical protein
MPNLSIELLKPHTHAGKRIKVGDRLDLNDASARWLITQGTAKAATPATDSNPPAVMPRPVFPQLQPPRRLNMAYFSGQGRVYIGARDELGNPAGLTFVGNVPELKVSLSVDTIEHQKRSRSCA